MRCIVGKKLPSSDDIRRDGPRAQNPIRAFAMCVIIPPSWGQAPRSACSRPRVLGDKLRRGAGIQVCG